MALRALGCDEKPNVKVKKVKAQPGDRTKRHNRLRTVLAAKATAAGLSPEVEKMGLLPERPEELGQ